MRRITLLLLVIGGLAVTADAQILNVFAEVLKQARNDLNVDTTNTVYLPTREGNARIRNAMSLVNRLVGDNRTNTTVPLAINRYKYALPDSALGGYSTIVSVQWIRSDTIKALNFVQRGKWYEQEHQWTRAQKGITAHPSHYDFYDDTLYVHPMPSRVDTLYVTSVDRIVGLDTVSTLEAIHEDFRDAILKYVVYQTAKTRQHPLTAMYKEDYQLLWFSLFPNFRPQAANAQ